MEEYSQTKKKIHCEFGLKIKKCFNFVIYHIYYILYYYYY